MTGPEGEDNCSECGLFWMYHKMRRPLGVGVGIDVVGPKREARGPRIMERSKVVDSRKRRMGSVITGSGSESERDDDDMDMDIVDGVKQDRQKETNDMNIDSPTPDDSPISLINLTILARKVQCTSLLIRLT